MMRPQSRGERITKSPATVPTFNYRLSNGTNNSKANKNYV